MIDLELLKGYYPYQLRENPDYHRYMIKEYIQLMVLDYLATTSYIRKIVFIGGTNLRLVKGIDRFSEDLDFDCKDLSKDEFMKMTDDIFVFLRNSGFRVEARDRENNKLKAFRRNIYFPELLFDLGLSGYKQERFLIKVESQDQEYEYQPQIINISRNGFFFPFPVPPDTILCAMKISALLSRQKGRDFYDTIFLLSLTDPDYKYLAIKQDIHNSKELKEALIKVTSSVDLTQKNIDFEHLLFNKLQGGRILHFNQFIKTHFNSLKPQKGHSL